jgi:hypothetical protein
VNLNDIKEGWLNYLMTNMFRSRKPTPQLQKHIDERFQACMACPHLKEKTFFSKHRKWRTCGKCGCAFPAMIFAYGKRCPDRRWDVVPKEARESKE